MYNSFLYLWRKFNKRRTVVVKHFLVLSFFILQNSYLYSGPIISGKITTTNSIPVNQAKVSFVNVADTNRRFFSLSDSLGNYIITIAGVESKDKEVTDFKLYQNYPNPFSERTTITYQIKQQAPIVISIYNILGQKVKTFRQEFAGQNIGQVQWDGRDGLGKKVASGIYFYSVSVGDKRQVKKMLFVDNLTVGETATQVFRKTTNYYVEDIYRDSSNVYTVYIENTDSTEPMIEYMVLDNIILQGDTVINFQVNEFKLPQWPMIHHDASGRGHQGINPYLKGLQDTSVEVVWNKVFNQAIGLVSIGPEGNVYVGTELSDTLLYVFSPNGTLLWSIYGVGASRIGVQLAIKDDGTLILSANTFNGAFTASYTSNGIQKWRVEVGATRSLPAISKEGIIYFTTYEGQLYAINSFDGDIVWVKNNARGESSPAIAKDGTIYYSDLNDKVLIALYPDGTEKWRYTDSLGCFVENLVIDSEGDLYYYKSGDYNLYCLSSAGTLKWIGKGGGSNYAYLCPAIMPNGNIVSVTSGFMYTYNPSGELQWEKPAPNGKRFNSSPLIDKAENIYITGFGLDSVAFYRITKLGKIDIINKNYIYIPWWLTISDTGILYYIGGKYIGAVK